MSLLIVFVFMEAAGAGSDMQAREVPPGYGTIRDFLPCEYPEGSGRWVVLSEANMPLRVSVGRSNRPPKGGTREEAREVVIEAMEEWAEAIRTQRPWFRLEYREADVDADVSVRWKRGSSARTQGQSQPWCGKRGGQLFTGGQMNVVLQACPTCRVMAMGELHGFVIHNFGHLLGLGDCINCGAAMNREWSLLGRPEVTRVDVEAAVDWWMREKKTPLYDWGDSKPLPSAESPSGPKPLTHDADSGWKRQKNSRLYAETAGGGFEVVEGWRLRLGPEEGERWYTFDEMAAIKSKREALEAGP